MGTFIIKNISFTSRRSKDDLSDIGAAEHLYADELFVGAKVTAEFSRPIDLCLRLRLENPYGQEIESARITIRGRIAKAGTFTLNLTPFGSADGNFFAQCGLYRCAFYDEEDNWIRTGTFLIEESWRRARLENLGLEVMDFTLHSRKSFALLDSIRTDDYMTFINGHPREYTPPSIMDHISEMREAEDGCIMLFPYLRLRNWRPREGHCIKVRIYMEHNEKWISISDSPDYCSAVIANDDFLFPGDLNCYVFDGFIAIFCLKFMIRIVAVLGSEETVILEKTYDFY